jgi:hypothetical protein
MRCQKAHQAEHLQWLLITFFFISTCLSNSQTDKHFDGINTRGESEVSLLRTLTHVSDDCVIIEFLIRFSRSSVFITLDKEVILVILNLFSLLTQLTLIVNVFPKLRKQNNRKYYRKKSKKNLIGIL